MSDTLFDREVLSAEKEIVRGEFSGHWTLKLECGHSVFGKTRADCKKYPNKDIFCGQCYGAMVVRLWGDMK